MRAGTQTHARMGSNMLSLLKAQISQAYITNNNAEFISFHFRLVLLLLLSFLVTVYDISHYGILLCMREKARESKRTILEGHITNGKWRMSAHKFNAADSICAIHGYGVCLWIGCVWANCRANQWKVKQRRHQLRLGREPSKSRNWTKNPKWTNWVWIESNWTQLNGMKWTNERVLCLVSSLSDACARCWCHTMWQTLARNMKNVSTKNFRLFAYEQWMAMTNRHVATTPTTPLRRCLPIFSTKCFM